MFHIVAHTVRGRLLFRTWPEGLEVWRTILKVVPHPDAVCVMPDHIHLLCPVDVRARLGRALGGLARRRNANDLQRGPLFRRLPAAEPVPRNKLQRVRRYIHLNPCRAGLVDDPLAWPLSTHRDALRLTWPRVGPARRDHFHAYVSADPTSHVAGTLLPGGAVSTAHLWEVLAAVSAVLRIPEPQLRRHPDARALAWHAAYELHPTTKRDLARALGGAERSLTTLPAADPTALQCVRRIACDPRFGGLHEGPLLHDHRWSFYRSRASAPRHAADRKSPPPVGSHPIVG